MKMFVCLLMMACSSSEPVQPEPAQSEAVDRSSEAPVASAPTDEHVGVHEGIQHPPIPADSPAWKHDPGGFVPDVRFYGERDWDGVRMRVAGHIAIIERDRARLAAGNGQLEEASQIYFALARTLQDMIPDGGGPAVEIPRMAQQAAQRDGSLMKALVDGRVKEPATGLAGVRSVLLTHGEKPLDEQTVGRLNTTLDVALSIEPKPDIDAFSDFDDRHQLRVRLWSLYLDAVDPIEFGDPWGYFTWANYAATAQILRTQIEGKKTEAPPPKAFGVEGVGGMPTGDSLIDVAGQPGPKAIGRLARLGLDDPKHLQWVEDTVYVLNAKMKESPGAVLPILNSRVAFLNGLGHGSRYYNIKQLRNEIVRRLADAGRPRLARQALALNYPLHHQDWECPNRKGILAAIDGRLAAIAGDRDASERLSEARKLSDAFLSQVAEVDR